MNKYQYEDIYIGLTAKFTIEINQEYIDSFRKHTGDTNPLHKDDTFAQEKGYVSKVAFGMLIASFYSTLAGVHLPGENSLIHSVEVKFLKPVFCDDKLTITGTVIDKNDLFKLTTIKADIKNQNNQKVSKAILKVGVI